MEADVVLEVSTTSFLCSDKRLSRDNIPHPGSNDPQLKHSVAAFECRTGNRSTGGIKHIEP